MKQQQQVREWNWDASCYLLAGQVPLEPEWKAIGSMVINDIPEKFSHNLWLALHWEISSE